FVVLMRVERDKLVSGLVRAITEELVEHFLPGRRVHHRGLGHHAVHVEQAGRYPVRKPEHSPSAEITPASPACLRREVRLVLWNFEISLGQFLDVDVFEGDYAHVLYEPGGTVHVPHPVIPHRNLEEDLTVIT